MLDHMRGEHADVMTTIDSTGELNEETEGKIKGALDAFSSTFA